MAIWRLPEHWDIFWKKESTFNTYKKSSFKPKWFIDMQIRRIRL